MSIDKLLDSLQWHMTPKGQGQIVEYRYACDETYLYTYVLDRSDRSQTVYREEWDQDIDDPFEPWNGLLPTCVDGTEQQLVSGEWV